jgi:Tfp pilus assembly protein PilF
MAKSRNSFGPVYVIGVIVFVGLIALAAWRFTRPPSTASDARNAFAETLAAGKTLYEKGEPAKAADYFTQALAMNPANPDAHLALGNALLRLGQTAGAAEHGREVVRYEPGNAAGHYLIGCAALRQNQYSNAVQSFELSKQIDRTVNAVSFQLGRAWFQWGKFTEAAGEFREVLEFETNTAAPIRLAAQYLLGQSLLRLGQADEGAKVLAEHQKLTAGKTGGADDPSVYEACVHTEIHATFPLEQPDHEGTPVKFVDDTQKAFGAAASGIKGPLAVMDVNHRGANDLLAVTAEGVALLWNDKGAFAAKAPPLALPAAEGATRLIVGDLQNDRIEDAVLTGPKGVVALRFMTNGSFSDATRFAGLAGAKGTQGVLADLDFTGKLGLWTADGDGHVRGYTNLGYGTFKANPPAFGGDLAGVTDMVIDDWNNDDLPDLLLVRPGKPPMIALNARGTGLAAPQEQPEWPAARALATGDLNNDLRTDAVLVTEDAVAVVFGGIREPLRLAAKGNHLVGVRCVDFDNDGWLDIVAWGGEGVRVWRNRGNAGFHDVTAALGLDTAVHDAVASVAAADFDGDGDIDFIATLASGGVRLLRNDGGDANHMLRLHVRGNRSNATGLGVKIELAAGGWHTIRTVQSLPVEVGVGKRCKLDAVTTRWFETRLDTTEVEVCNREPLEVFELVIPGGSCPYLYAWNGSSNRFVTDVLGAAPAGLPVVPGVMIPADTDEFVHLGAAEDLAPINGRWRTMLTEELKEILYLDTAKLLVIDHPPGVEAHPTGRLVPRPPFPEAGVALVGGRRPLRHAEDLEGNDVTSALSEIDQVRVSPKRLRGIQYRGLAEPWGVTLDFGPLDASRPLILALTGWLRFGGGMANIAASQNPELPFPFPKLEAEVGGVWRDVDVVVGAPAGKTKTILVDLTGKLPAGTGRLRLTQAFEIHWDRAAMFTERGGAAHNPTSTETPSEPGGNARFTWLNPAATDLHWHGYSEYEPLPWTSPLTPIHESLRPKAPYEITPSGWATRYGPVDDLLASKDDGLVIIAGGDELSIDWDPAGLPARPEGWRRDVFLFVSGWDKDADYHVVTGDTIAPLPWHAMDDQRYGHEERPARASDALHAKYNTRWVGPKTLAHRR